MNTMFVCMWTSFVWSLIFTKTVLADKFINIFKKTEVDPYYNEKYLLYMTMVNGSNVYHSIIMIKLHMFPLFDIKY